MKHDLALSILRGNRNYEKKLLNATSDKYPEAKAVKAETIRQLEESIEALEQAKENMAKL